MDSKKKRGVGDKTKTKNKLIPGTPVVPLSSSSAGSSSDSEGENSELGKVGKSGSQEVKGVEAFSDTLSAINKGVRDTVMEDEVEKSLGRKVMTLCAEYEKLVIDLLIENGRLKGIIEGGSAGTPTGGRSESWPVEAGRQPSPAGVSALFAPRSVPAKPDVPSYAVVVRAVATSKEGVPFSGDKVKEMVLAAGKNVEGLRVKTLRKIKEGVAIEVSSEVELKKLKDSAELREAGLVTSEPQRAGVRVMIMDVPKELGTDAFMGQLFEKNLQAVGRPEFGKSKVVKRVPRGSGATENVVIEVTNPVRDSLLAEGRVYVGWSALRVKEWDSVTRCYGCHGYRHMRKDCPWKQGLCLHCGGEGHYANVCQHRQVCRNCAMKGLRHDHSIMSAQCPEYVRECERLRTRIIA